MQQYTAQTDGDPALRRDAAKVPGIRLIDPSIVSETFKQLEQIRPFYTFPDSLDVDRYTIKGKVQDSVVAVRELNLNGLGADQRNWFNDHIVYTHGFGLVAAHGDARDSTGQPVFNERNIPSTGDLGTTSRGCTSARTRPTTRSSGGRATRSSTTPTRAPSGRRTPPTTAAAGSRSARLSAGCSYAIKFREQNILLSPP